MKVKCPNCSVEYAVFNKRNCYFGCKSCGQYYNVVDGKYIKVHKYNKNYGRADCPIEVGMKGKINNKSFTVATRIKYKSTYREYDDEKSNYSNEQWTYEEFYLYTAEGELLLLVYDSEGFTSISPIIPDDPKLPERNNNFISFFSEHPDSRIQEQGNSHIVFIEGELNERFDLPYKIYFTTYFRGAVAYTVESIEDSTKYITDIKFYEERLEDEVKVIDAFSSSPKIKKLFLNVWIYSYLINSLYLGAGICFILWIISNFKSDQALSSHFIYFNASDSAFLNRGYYTEPIKLTEKGVYRFYFAVHYSPDNSNLGLEIDLVDNKTKEIINNIDADFYQESGYDDEGSWTEREVDGSLFYKIDSPTEFFARVRMDKETYNYGQRGEMMLTIYKDLILEYYAIAGLLFLLLALVLYCVRYYTLPRGSVPILNRKEMEWLIFLIIVILVAIVIIILK